MNQLSLLLDFLSCRSFNPICWSQVIPTRTPTFLTRIPGEHTVSILYVGVRLFLHRKKPTSLAFLILVSILYVGVRLFLLPNNFGCFCKIWVGVSILYVGVRLFLPIFSSFLIKPFPFRFNPLCWSQVIPTTLCLSNSSRAQKRRVSILYVGVRLFLQILNLNP